MHFDLVDTPASLTADRLAGRVAVVFDVLRATTSMTTALAAGCREIRVFANVDEVRVAAGHADSPKLLAGERQCLRPDGFDLGNSPADFADDRVRDATLLMATTNGTRAILSSLAADVVLIGCLRNATAVAGVIQRIGRDVMLVCAGTNGRCALEDLAGAGAVIDACLLRGEDAPALTHGAMAASNLFRRHRDDLPHLLASTDGGRNVIAAGLASDVTFSAGLDAAHAVGRLVERAKVPTIRTIQTVV